MNPDIQRCILESYYANHLKKFPHQVSISDKNFSLVARSNKIWIAHSICTRVHKQQVVANFLFPTME